MNEAVFALVGLVIGAAVVYLVLSSRFKMISAKEISNLQARHADEIRDSEGRAKGAEASVVELRLQLREAESEKGKLRSELDLERQQRIETSTRLEESYKRLDDSYKNLEEQKALFEVMKKEMSDTFNALSAAALKSSSEDFLRLASESLGKVVVDTKGRLGEHHAAIDATVKPLQELLKRYEQQIKESEESRHKSFGSLSEQIRSLSSMQ